ncbi:MAG: hypothetical protein UR11_C0001G0238 [Candidatus Woesebacteria bacterium GW2011_GWC1_30_29]|nr:MAG: hypothetical protein UR11_C0001G0238 [Candidatus Woesebacteria bacterium GW2011_GWC1_30_29]
MLTGILINALLSFYLSHIFSIKMSTWITLLSGISLYLFTFKNYKLKISFDKGYILFNIFWLICFGLVISQTHLKSGESYLSGSPSTSGDLPFHLGLISNFAYGDNFPPINPIASFKTINYHFVADFVSAQLLVLGSGLRYSLIIPSTIFGLLLVNSLYLLAFKILNNNRASYLSVFLFLFNGGLGFTKPILDELPLSTYINATTRFSYLPQLGVGYAGIFAEMLMAQRTLLVGVPLWIFATYLLILLINNKTNLRIFAISAFIAGLLPYANIYAFLVFALALLFVVVSETIKAKKISELFFWIKYGLLIFIVSGAFILPVIFTSLGSKSFIRFSFSEWPPVDGTYNKLFFYLTNFGIPFLFGSIISVMLFFKKIFKNRNIILVNVFIIFLANIIIFQPYVWDNSRFVLYPYIMISILASYLIIKLIESKIIVVKILGYCFLFLSVVTGILISINDPRMLGGIFKRNDLIIAEEIREISRPNEIFLTARNSNNIITALSGRKIFLGFGGYLWTHGITDTTDKEMAILAIFDARDGYKELIKKFGINYIYISGWERREYLINEEKLRFDYPVVYDKNGILILKTATNLPSQIY